MRMMGEIVRIGAQKETHGCTDHGLHRDVVEEGNVGASGFNVNARIGH